MHCQNIVKICGNQPKSEIVRISY